MKLKKILSKRIIVKVHQQCCPVYICSELIFTILTSRAGAQKNIGSFYTTSLEQARSKLHFP